MAYERLRHACVACVVTAILAAAVPANAAMDDPGAPAPWFVYGVIIVVLVAGLIALLLIRAAVAGSTWSLADALSEDTEVTARLPDGGVMMHESKPVTVVEMRASSSRLIALMGMMAILLMFLGFGAFALFRFAMTGEMPDDIDEVVNFLLAGLTLFAPYLVNKFSGLFEGLAPKK
jgi:hypothetical protein